MFRNQWGGPGYASVSLLTDDWLVIPYVGLGGFGYTLNIRNLSGESYELYGPGSGRPRWGSASFSSCSRTQEGSP